MKVKGYYPVTLTIDSEEIVLRLKRMTYDEFSTFTQGMARVATSTIARFVSRAPTGPEQARDEQGRYRLSFEQLCEERLAAMTPDERARFDEAVQADEREAQTFLRDTFEQFVTVERGLTEETEDGREVSVTTGLDFLRVFGARRDVLLRVIGALQRENTLDARQKKVSPSPSASRTGSRPPARGRAGRRRATTASPAGTAVSAGTEDVTSKPETTDASSGSIATSGRRGAPSLN